MLESSATPMSSVPPSRELRNAATVLIVANSTSLSRSSAAYPPSGPTSKRRRLGPLVPGQWRHAERFRRDEAGRDLTAASHPNLIHGRVARPALRADRHQLARLPTHPDEPARTTVRDARPAASRGAALDLARQAPHHDTLGHRAVASDRKGWRPRARFTVDRHAAKPGISSSPVTAAVMSACRRSTNRAICRPSSWRAWSL